MGNRRRVNRRNLFVSIIIQNYNYAEFVGAAIDSAIKLDWPDKEVIVVDDGSTDGSRAVIERYADRAALIFQQRSTQRVAYNAGFAASRGNAVIFLDADDLLHPMLMREVAAVWRPDLSKVQVQMARVDAGGAPLGSVFPPYDIMPTPERIRDWLRQTSGYPTPPGSGNIYARTFLEKIFPLDDSCGDTGDSPCLAAAPYLGDIVTIAKPLVSYRVHGRNYSALSTLDAARFAREVTTARRRFAFSQRIAATAGIIVPDDHLNKSLHYLQHRLVSVKLAAAFHPVVGDSVAAVLADVLRSAIIFPAAARKTRLAILLWALAVAISPQPVAERLVLWKFVPSAQPGRLRKALSRLGVVQAPSSGYGDP